MICDELVAHVLQLYETEKLSIRQISDRCGMCRKTISHIVHSQGTIRRRSDSDKIVNPYRRLIESWYAELPKLKATQVYDRLRGLGFKPSPSKRVFFESLTVLSGLYLAFFIA